MFCTGLYIVQSGNVGIFKSSAGGREQVLSMDGNLIGKRRNNRSVSVAGDLPFDVQPSRRASPTCNFLIYNGFSVRRRVFIPPARAWHFGRSRACRRTADRKAQGIDLPA